MPTAFFLPRRTLPLRTTLMLVVLLGLALPCNGQLDRAKVEKTKSATALVERPSGDGFGTTFCISKNGFFITNEHVISGLNERIPLILNPGTKQEAKIFAEIVRKSADKDLALLRAIKPPKELVWLELGKDKDLFETQQISAFGYPFGTSLALRSKKYPNISINVGRITSLRRKGDTLKAIQVDAVLNPGNSGGPVIDEAGKVVGVVVEKIEGTDVNFAIPISEVKEFLSRPEIVLKSPDLRFALRHREAKLEFELQSFGDFGQELEKLPFRLRLTNGLDKAQELELTPNTKGLYTATFIPVQPTEGMLKFPVSIFQGDGSIKGEMKEQEFTFGNSRQHFAEMRKFEKTRDGWKITRYDGVKATQKSFKFDIPKVFLGESSSLLLDMDNIKKIEVGQPKRFVQQISYKALVMRGTKIVSSIKGKLDLVGAPGKAKDIEEEKYSDAEPSPSIATYTLPTGKPKFDDEAIIYELDEPFESYVMAGADRYMIFKMPESKRIAIFDLLAGDIVHEVKNVAPDALVCGGASNFFVVLPSQMLVQRWSLKTFEREKTSRLPLKNMPQQVHMGVNSDEYILVFDGFFGYVIDVERLKPLASEEKLFARFGSHGQRFGRQVDVSADGNLFGTIARGLGPISYEALLVTDSKVLVREFSSTSNSHRWAEPTADGRLFLMRGGKIFNILMNDVSPSWLEGARLYATVDPRYFIALRFKQDAKENYTTSIDVCTTSDFKIIHSNTQLKELAPEGNTSARGYTTRKLDSGTTRVHYIPWAGLIANTDYDKKRVYIRKYEWQKELKETGEDYLFVDSLPPLIAYKGKQFSYQISSQSNSSSVSYKLTEGPSGMRVSSTGLLTWTPKRGSVEEPASVVITITSANGDETFHSFDLLVTTKIALKRQKNKNRSSK